MPDHVKGQPAVSMYVPEKGCLTCDTHHETPCRIDRGGEISLWIRGYPISSTGPEVELFQAYYVDAWSQSTNHNLVAFASA